MSAETVVVDEETLHITLQPFGQKEADGWLLCIRYYDGAINAVVSTEELRAIGKAFLAKAGGQ